MLVFPSFSYSDCLEHLYVEMVHCFMLSSLLFFTRLALGLLGVVKEMLLVAIEQPL